ncbi:MAG: HAD-IA family hydrolase [Actinomycetota bacterium]|nr:HAD-IA family hydrolase [Actinomycetota bacterium]
MVNAVLFDLYDTFVWSRWGELSDHLADRLGIDRAALHRAYDLTRPARSTGTYGSAEGDMAAVVTAAGVEPDPALIQELTTYERAFLADGGITLYEDSLEVAAELKARGTRTALVSNCSHSTIGVVERLGLADVLDVLVLSVTAGVAKPDAGIYRAALGALGAEPEGAVFVDDQARYCDGAAALGIATRLIVRPSSNPVEGFAADTNGHAVIADLHELLV